MNTVPPYTTRVPVLLFRTAICLCGHPVLRADIPLGTTYEIDPSRVQRLLFICGGCGAHRPHLLCVWVYERENSQPGFLPLQIFSPVALDDPPPPTTEPPTTNTVRH